LDFGCRASRRKLATSRLSSAISFQKQCNSILIRSTSRRLGERLDGLLYNSFLCSNRTLDYSEILDSVRTCCNVVQKTCRDFPNSVDFWNPTPCWILIDLAVRTVLLYHLDVFKANCWILRGVRTPSKARQDGCTGTDWFGLEFVRTLHGHLLEACDQSHALIWTLSEYMNWEPTILLIRNHYIKCFLLSKM
jgi:hypothetical protein